MGTNSTTTAGPATNLSQLIEIAEKAIDVQNRAKVRKVRKGALARSYLKWKGKHDIDRVERDTLDWTRMMVATKREYEQFEDAKREEKNARRRLETAIRRYEGEAA